MWKPELIGSNTTNDLSFEKVPNSFERIMATAPQNHNVIFSLLKPLLTYTLISLLSSIFFILLLHYLFINIHICISILLIATHKYIIHIQYLFFFFFATQQYQDLLTQKFYLGCTNRGFLN